MSQGSTVSGCSSAGTVRSYSDYAGGIVGDCSATSSTTLTVADCQNTGTVYCNYRYAGGITGGLYYGTITNCINTGRIELHSFHSSRAEGVQEGGGGIMGYWQAGGVITNCFNGGVVSVSNQYAGGITGRSSSSSKVQLRGNVALGYVDCPSMNNRGAVGHHGSLGHRLCEERQLQAYGCGSRHGVGSKGLRSLLHSVTQRQFQIGEPQLPAWYA